MAKSTVEREGCTCGLDVRPEIWLCPHHVYRKGGREFTSVSKVIKTLLPADYSAVDPVVLEIARLRGTFVDTYFSEWLQDPLNTLPFDDVQRMVEPEFPRENAKHAKDTVQRIEMLLNWWTAQNYKPLAVQKIVYSDKDGVAGQLDVSTVEILADVKCVSQLQPNYALQLGAYLDYYDDWSHGAAGIIWVTKDKVKLVPYSTEKCREQWRNCFNWYRTLKTLQ